jgi:UDP-2,3-diacylglucosamine hydrolase
MDDYFQKELNIPVYYDNQEYTLEIKPFDRPRDGKGPGDMGTHEKKYLQIRFLNGFSWVHPDIGVRLAQYP